MNHEFVINEDNSCVHGNINAEHCYKLCKGLSKQEMEPCMYRETVSKHRTLTSEIDYSRKRERKERRNLCDINGKR